VVVQHIRRSSGQQLHDVCERDRIIGLVHHVNGGAGRSDAAYSRPFAERDHLNIETGAIETLHEVLDVDLRSAACPTRHQLGDDDALHAVDLDHATGLATGGRSTNRR
jgi:hypothetical protein